MQSRDHESKTFQEQIEDRNAFVRGMVIGAALAGYGTGTAKAHVVPAVQATGKKLAELAPEALRIAGRAYLGAVELGHDNEQVRKVERAAKRAWAEARSALRHFTS